MGESSLAERLGRFAVLAILKSEVEDELDAIKKEIAELQPVLLGEMTNFGLVSTKIEQPDRPDVTISIKRDIHANVLAHNRGKVVEGMLELGLGDLVKTVVDPKTLSAWVREQAPEMGLPVLPEVLAPYVQVAEVFSLKTRIS